MNLRPLKRLMQFGALATLAWLLSTQFYGASATVSNEGTDPTAYPRQGFGPEIRGFEGRSVARGQVSAYAAPVTIDGAKTPELIPDYIAYRHFIMAIAGHDGPPVATRDHTGTGRRNHHAERKAARREAILGAIGFSSVDRDTILTTLKDVGIELDAASIPEALPVERKARRDQVFTHARAALEQGMSPAGRVLLHDYIQQSKSAIKVFGDLPH